MSREALVVGINSYPFLKNPQTKKPKHLSLPAADAEAVASDAIAKSVRRQGRDRQLAIGTVASALLVMTGLTLSTIKWLGAVDSAHAASTNNLLDAKFSETRQLDDTVDSLATKEEGKKRAAEQMIEKGEELVRDGKVKEALAAYAKAKQLYPQLQISADSWNTLCWNGSLYQEAAMVMGACERGVALNPENGFYRGSRGLARALTGDTPGAIKDFQAFVKWSESQEGGDEERKLVQGWIDALRAGEDPFTEEVLQMLRQ